jgi:CrcB protein
MVRPVRQATRIYLMVGLGSSLGAVARYFCSQTLIHLAGPVFPWGTLAVNVIGSFVIGLYASLTEPDGRIFASPARRQFVLAGFCGGFTTFSIFSLETLRLAAAARYDLAAANIVASIVLWLVAVWFGHRVGRRINRLKGT